MNGLIIISYIIQYGYIKVVTSSNLLLKFYNAILVSI